MIKVYQVQDEYVTFCSKAPEPRTLTLVAEVSGDFGDLQTAFNLTNSCEDAWYDNTRSKRLKVIKEARSTSVGDVMEADGIFYLVASRGFTPLEDFRLPTVEA